VVTVVGDGKDAFRSRLAECEGHTPCASTGFQTGRAGDRLVGEGVPDRLWRLAHRHTPTGWDLSVRLGGAPMGKREPRPGRGAAMDLRELARRYDEELRTEAYADIDASANGLQVGAADGSVEHVAVAVDAAQATIEAAVDVGADALVVHHGLSWGGIERITGPTHDRIAALIENDLGLYVSHLPLDGHQELGNAAGLADLLDLVDRTPFGTVGGEPIGLRGRIPDGYDAEALAGRLETDLETGDRTVQTLDHGPERLQELAIVTGAGTDHLEEAVDAGVDALLTGEGKGRAYHAAREAGITVLLAGHYATETFGVRNLATLAEEWGLETTYVSHPTGL
jgi:dinuclear metal center YbgI/SA1388 family protein